MPHEEATTNQTENAESERIVEYAVNVTNGADFPWNPFEKNFDWQADADAAAIQCLRDNPELQSADVHELVIEGDQITAYQEVSSHSREDIAETPSSI